MGSILDDLCMYYIFAHLVEYDNIMIGSYIVLSCYVYVGCVGVMCVG